MTEHRIVKDFDGWTVQREKLYIDEEGESYQLKQYLWPKGNWRMSMYFWPTEEMARQEEHSNG